MPSKFLDLYTDPRFQALSTEDKQRLLRGEFTLDQVVPLVDADKRYLESQALSQKPPVEQAASLDDSGYSDIGSMRPVEEGFFDQLYGATVGSGRQGLAQGKKGLAFLAQQSGIGSEEELASYLREQERISQASGPAEQQQRALQDISQSKGFVDAAGKIVTSPLATLSVISSSIGQMLPVMSASLAGTAAGGPLGGAVGAGSSSLATEYSSSVMQAIQEAGYDPTDTYQIAQFLRDPEKMQEAKSYALKRAVPVALFDAATAGLAGKFLKGINADEALVKPLAKELTVQAGGGMGGELSAQLVSEGKITSPGDILLEGFAELPSAAVEIPGNLSYARTQRELTRLRSSNPDVDAGLEAAAEMQKKAIEEINNLIGGDKVAAPENLIGELNLGPSQKELFGETPEVPSSQDMFSGELRPVQQPVEDTNRIIKLNNSIKEYNQKLSSARTEAGRKGWREKIAAAEKELEAIRGPSRTEESQRELEQDYLDQKQQQFDLETRKQQEDVAYSEREFKVKEQQLLAAVDNAGTEIELAKAEQALDTFYKTTPPPATVEPRQFQPTQTPTVEQTQVQGELGLQSTLPLKEASTNAQTVRETTGQAPSSRPTVIEGQGVSSPDLQQPAQAGQQQGRVAPLSQSIKQVGIRRWELTSTDPVTGNTSTMQMSGGKDAQEFLQKQADKMQEDHANRESRLTGKGVIPPVSSGTSASPLKQEEVERDPEGAPSAEDVKEAQRIVDEAETDVESAGDDPGIRRAKVVTELARRKIGGMNVYFDDATTDADGRVQGARFNEATGDVEINAAVVEDPADIVATAAHEVTHALSTAKDQGVVMRKDIGHMLGSENRARVNARLTALATSSPLIREAIAKAKESGNPEVEMLTYAVEEIRLAREKEKSPGARVMNFIRDIVALIKGNLSRLGWKSLSNSFNEADLYRLSKIVLKEYSKGTRPVPVKGGEVLESRRPAQPKAQQRTANRVQDATLGKSDVDGVSLPSSTLGIKKPKSKRPQDESRVEKIVAGLAGQFSAIAGANRNVFEALKQGRGGAALALREAAQAMNRMEKAVVKASTSGLKQVFRRSYLSTTRAIEIRNLLSTISEGGGDTVASTEAFDKALVQLEQKYPGVYQEWHRSRNIIDKFSVQLMKLIVSNPAGMTNRDIDLIKSMKKNMGSYLTREYLVFQDDKIKKLHLKNVLATKGEKGGVYENAREHIRKHVLDIGEFNEIVTKAREDLDNDSINLLEDLYNRWIPAPLRKQRPAGNTVEQNSAWVESTIQQLKDYKAMLGGDKYLQELDQKATAAVDDLIQSFTTGEDAALKEYYSGLKGETGILQKKKQVPKALRELMGEITNPLIKVHQTINKMGKEVSRVETLLSIHNGNEGVLWEDSANRKDPDTFNTLLKGDRYGPLSGKYVSKDVADQIIVLERLNDSLDAIEKARKQGDNRSTVSYWINWLMDKIGLVNTWWKLSQIIVNLANGIMDFSSTPEAIAGDGWVPYANKEARNFAFGAAYYLINSADRTEMSDSAKIAMRNALVDSATVGEMQEADQKALEEQYLKSFANEALAKQFALKVVWAHTKRVVSKGKRYTSDLKAMSDVVGKLYNFKMELEFQRELDKAKKKENPSFKLRSERKLETDSSALIDDTNIGYHRAAPIGRSFERVLIGMLMNFITETGRTSGNKFRVAATTLLEAKQYPAGSEARSMLVKRGNQRLAGAIIYAGVNTAKVILLANFIAFAAAKIGGEDEEEKAEKDLEIIDSFREALPASDRSKAWILPQVVDGRLFIFDASRTGIAEPTTQPVIDMLTGITKMANGDEDNDYFERAAGSAANLFIGSPLFKILSGRKPSLAKTDPEVYNALEKQLDTTAANLVGNLYDSFIPRQLRQMKQVLSEGAPQSSLGTPSKIALAAGFNLRMWDPAYDLPNSSFDYVTAKREDRSDIANAIRLDNKSPDDFKQMYLDASLNKIEQAEAIINNISLARKIGTPEETIALSLGRDGFAGKRGAFLSKPDIELLMKGAVDPVVIAPKDLKEEKKKELSAAQGDTTKIRAVEVKYDRYEKILDQINSTISSRR